MELMDMLRAARPHSDSDERTPRHPHTEAVMLRDALAAYNTKHDFKVGDIVRQKAGVRGYRNLGDGLSIVVKVLDEPIPNPEGDMNDCDFAQIADLVIGEINSDGSFLFFHVDSRRLEPVPDAEISL